MAGVEYGRVSKAPVAERRRRELLGGSGGMPPLGNFEISGLCFETTLEHIFIFFATPKGGG